MAKFMWDRELIQLLITEYEQKQNLYDPRHKDYCNRIKRDKAEKEILEKLKNISPSLNQNLLRVKIQSLRSQYKRELRTIETSKRSGAGAEDIYEPRLWCFEQLKFLQPHCEMKMSSSNIDDVIFHDKENNIIAETIANTSEDAAGLQTTEERAVELFSSTPKARKKFNLKAEIAETLSQTRALIERKNNDNDHLNLECIGMLVVSQLQEIKNTKIRKDTIWDIQCALRKGIEKDEEFQSAQSAPTCSPSSSSCGSQSKITIKSIKIVKPPSTAKSGKPLVPKRDALQEAMEGLFDDEI